MPLKILIAEDVPLNAKLLARNLTNYNCNCCIAGNGQEAVEKSKTQAFDLIFMDFEMPVLNGLDATRQIRSDITNRNSRTQIIGLTGASQEDLAKGLDAGMNKVVDKQVRMTNLRNLLQEAFPDHRIERKKPSTTISPISSHLITHYDWPQTAAPSNLEKPVSTHQQIQVQAIDNFAHTIIPISAVCSSTSNTSSMATYHTPRISLNCFNCVIQ